MTAHQRYLTSLITTFSTFVSTQKDASNLEHQITNAFVAFVDWKRDYATWSAKELEEFAKKVGYVDAKAVEVIARFLSQYSLHQASVWLHEYLLALKTDGCSESTIRNYRSDIQQFVHFSGATNLESLITKPKLAEFAHAQLEKGLKHSSVTRKLSSIVQFGLWALRDGILSQDLSWTNGLSAERLVPPPTHATKTRRGSWTHAKPQEPTPNSSKSSFPLRSSAPTSAAHLSPIHNQELRARLKKRLSHLTSGFKNKTNRSLLPYLNLGLLALFFLGLGTFGYFQVFRDVPQELAYSSTPTRASRELSFQGRLTDTAKNPITTSTTMQFRLYDSGPSTSGGNLLWDSGSCSVDPDQDGIFAVGLGDDCGSEIGENVFTQNANVWLQVAVEAETLSPRQPIRTVAYAINAETVQGFPITATESAVRDSIVVMNSSGEVVLGENSPILKSVYGTFTIQGEALLFTTAPGSNGNIVFDADGTGSLISRDYISAPGATLSATYAGGTALVARGGPSGTANIQEWQNSSGTVLSAVDENGYLGILTSNPTSPLSVGASNEFQVDSSGNIVNVGGAAHSISNSGGNLVLNSAGNLVVADTTVQLSGGSSTLDVYSTSGDTTLSLSNSDGTYEANLSVEGQVRLGNFSADPTTIGAGSLYYNTSDNLLYYYNGSMWTVITSGSSSSSNFWTIANGAIHPSVTSLDLLIGGSATASAKIHLNASTGEIRAPIVNKTVVVDGTTYAQTCAGINAAIDALGSTGGEVFLPRGTYTCAETIYIDYNNTTIRGAGWGTIIDASAATLNPIISTNSKNYVTLKDFKVSGNAAAAGDNIAITLTGDYLTAENLYVLNGDYVGFYTCCSSTTNSILITGNTIETATYGVYASSYNTKVIGNTAISADLVTHTGSGQYSIFSNNTLTSSDISVADDNVTVANNKITAGGIAVSSLGLHAKITGNSIVDSGTTTPLSIGGNYAVVSGNEVVNTDAEWGAVISSNYVNFTDNVIGGDGDATSYGIWSHSGTDQQITNNHIRNVTTGMALQATNTIVADNTFDTVTTNYDNTGTRNYIKQAKSGLASYGSSSAPVNKLSVDGTSYFNNALFRLNETGSNDIFTASASGTTRLTLTNSGLLYLYSALNAGGLTGQSYNSFSDSTTASFASTDDDVYIEDILEVGGSLYVGGRQIDTSALWKNTLNVFHPGNEFAEVADLALGGTSTASANSYFSSQGWGFLTGARTGQALFQLNETGDQNIFTASKSGSTKVVIDNNGKVGIGTSTPLGLLNVEGAVAGKALGVFNETGDQDIFTASKSGITQVVVDKQGDVGIGTASANKKLDVWGQAQVIDTTDNDGSGADGALTLVDGQTLAIDGSEIATVSGRSYADAVNFSISTKLNTGSSTIDLGATPNGLAVGDEILIINLRDQSNVDSAKYGNVVESTATSGGASTLTDTSQSWVTNAYAGMTVSIMSGTGVKQSRTISSNTNDTLTVSSAWTTTPDSTSVYKILDNSAWSKNIANIKVGQYETKRITAISSNTLTLNQPLTNTYDGTVYSIMVQRVPNYTNVTIPGNAFLTVNGFSTSTKKGSVLFFRATGTVSVAAGGGIHANGKGYPDVTTNFAGGITYNGAGGNSTSTSNGQVGNGGGGGAGRQAALSLGASGTSGGGGGGGGFSRGAGAGGGYGTVGAGGGGHAGGVANGTSGSGNTGGEGGNNPSISTDGAGGGGGGTYGSADLSRLLPGSAGGKGGNQAGATGGDGGGIVFISADTISVSGNISANGGNGSTGVAGGGGGAGGSVWLQANTQSIGSSLVTATGGTGATGVSAGGSGGNGGDGRIRLDYGTLSGSSSPSAGYSQSISVSSTASFLVNRANSTGGIFAAQYAGSDKLRIDTSGNIINTAGAQIRPMSDSTTALQIANSGGTAYVNFDSTNSRVGIGDSSPVAALVIGSDATAGFANGAGDVYIQNDLEVDGNFYLQNVLIDPNAQWQNTLNVYHPSSQYADIADFSLGGTSTASANVHFSSKGWGFLTGARTGQALFQLNETGNQDIFTASVSGTTKARITNGGELKIGEINNTVIVDGVNYAQTCAGINAAIDALGSSGGEVFLPEGTYTCTETITIDANNTTIRGAGKGSKIVPSAWGSWSVPGHIIDTNTRDYLTFDNFQIDGVNSSGQSYALIYVNSTTDSLFNNLYLYRSDWVGLYQYWPSSRNTITNSVFQSNGSHGVYLHFSYYTKVSDNVFLSNTNSAVQIYDGSSSFHQVTNNTMDNNEYGVYITTSGHNLVDGNTISDSDIAGIYSPTTNNAYNSVITNNVINDSSDGNYTMEYGIFFASQLSHGTVIANNSIYGLNQAGAYGLYVGVGTSRVTVYDNNVYSNTTNVYIDPTSVNLTATHGNDGNFAIGSVATPTHKLSVIGKTTGKALGVFDETGDQDILVASKSGTTRFRIGNSGEIVSTNAGSNDSVFNLSSTGDLIIQDNGAAFATFTDGGVFTLDSLNLDGTTIGLTTDTDLLSLASNALTVNGDLRLADTYTFEVGGLTGVSYNAISNSTTATYASTDNDLYIEDILEVGTMVYAGGLTVDGVTFDATALWQNTAGLFHPGYEHAAGASLALGGTTTASANIHLDATTGYATAQRFVDKANSNYYLDPAAAGTSLAVAGSVAISGTAPATNYELDVTGDVKLSGQLTLGNLSANPTALGAGSMYYNSSDGNLYYYNGSAWTVITAGSAGAASNYWTISNGSIYTAISSLDLLIGGTATSSSKLALSATTGTITKNGKIDRKTHTTNFVAMYDTTKDDDGGAWRQSAQTKAASWYSETIDNTGATCSTSTDDRCGSREFPEKAIITGTTDNLYIWDAKDNSLWMRIGTNNTSNNAFADNAAPFWAVGKNGVLYVRTTGAGPSIMRIDFVNDTIYGYAASFGTYKGGIAQRHATAGYDSNLWRANGYANVATNQYGLDVETINGDTFVAVSYAHSTDVWNETANTAALSYNPQCCTYPRAIQITKGGELYVAEAGVLFQIDRYDNIHLDTAGSAPDFTWDETDTPSPTEDGAAPGILYYSPAHPHIFEVTEGTSTVDGTSNTLYLAHDDGLTIYNEKQGDETNGSVKYYTSSYITEEMVGDIRAMWPLNLNQTTSDLEDRSVKTNNLTATNIDSNDAASGVRGKGVDFNGTDENLAIATASDADLDFNGSEVFSISAWVKVTTMPGSGEKDLIIGKWDETSAQRGYRLFVENDDADSTGNFQVDIYDESADQTITATQSNDKVVADTWYHLVVTFNGGTAGAAGDVKLYVDNTLSSSSANTSFLGLEDVTSDVTIGDYDADDAIATHTAFAGVIDEVMVTAETLTQTQIQRLHDVGRGALVQHNTGEDRDDDGTNDTDDLQQFQNGNTRPYDIQLDDSKQALFIGTGNDNDGALSIIGVNNDSRLDTYTEDNSKTDDAGLAINSPANALSNVYSIAIAGEYTHPYLKGTKQSQEKPFYMAFTDTAYVWMESNNLDLTNALTTLAGSTIVKQNLLAQNSLKVLGYTTFQNNTGIGAEMNPEYAFSVDADGNLFSAGTFAMGTSSAYLRPYNTIGNGAAVATAGGQIKDGNDLFISDDLEIAGDLYLANGATFSGTLTQKAGDDFVLSGKKDLKTHTTGFIDIYDTSKDDDGGAWRNSAQTKATSWYNETIDAPGDTCVITTHDRCGSRPFPQKVYFTGTTDHFYIWDASDNSMWMKISSQDTNNNAIPDGTVFSGAVGKNGVIYVWGTQQRFRIDLVNDQIYGYSTTQGTYKGTISQRHSTSGYDARAWRTMTNVTNGYGLAVQTINGNTYLARTEANGGVQLYNETTNSAVTLYYPSGDAYMAFPTITKGGELYAQAGGFLFQLNRWDNIHLDTPGVTQTPDYVYDETTTPSLTEDGAAPAILYYTNTPTAITVTEGTSTAGDGSNTIYIPMPDDGVTVLNEKMGDEPNGSVKYYTNTYITEELIGDVRGYWPLNLNQSTADLEDRSVKANNLTATNVDSNDAASGVRGKGSDFDGSTEYLSVATASDADIDFNGTETFTISAWVNPTTMPGSGEKDLIVGKWDETSTQRGYRIFLENDDADSTGNFQVDIYDESADQTITATQSNDQVVASRWYHVVAVFNGGATGAAGDVKLYVDGVLSNSTGNASFLGLEDVTSDFTIGDYDPEDVIATHTAFAGVIDEVMVTAEKLTDSQVQRLYRVGKAALIQHNTGQDRDKDGTTDTDDLQQIQNGETDTYVTAVDSSNQVLFIGAGNGNDGSVSVFGLNNDSRLDTYTEDYGKRDDNGRGIGESGTILSHAYDLAVAGSYSNPYVDRSSQAQENFFTFAYSNLSYVWMESTDVSVRNVLTALTGSTITKEGFIANSSLTVLANNSLNTTYNTNQSNTPLEAFKVTNDGNVNALGTITANQITATNGVVSGGKATRLTQTANYVYIYDTTKDDDGGAWRQSARTKATSWYSETIDNTGANCSISTNDRCGSREFPEKAVIISTTDYIYIYDAKDNTMWMKFASGDTTNNILTDNFSSNAVKGKNGVLYVGSACCTLPSLLRLDFVNDNAYAYRTGYGTYKGTLAQRNSQAGWDAQLWRNNGFTTVSSHIHAIDAETVNGDVYIAYATVGEGDYVFAWNETAGTSSFYFGDNASDTMAHIEITKGGELYLFEGGTDFEMRRYDDIHLRLPSANYSIASANFIWDETDTVSPSEDGAAPNFTYGYGFQGKVTITEGTSTVDGKSNTIYYPTSDHLTVFQEKQGDETNSSVKYYTTSYITEELIGDARGYWPLNLNDTAADLEDRSVKTNNLTATNIDSTDAASGVRGKGADFNGTDEVLTVATASDADLDFNGSEPFTISVWVKPVTMPGSGEKDLIIGKWDETSSDQKGYRLILENDDADSTGNFQVDLYDESANQTITATQSNDRVQANKWYHLVVTFNGGTAGAAGDLKLYVDGATHNSTANTSFLGLEDVASDFTIGDYDADDAVATNTAFAGIIDEPMITSEILSQNDVFRLGKIGRAALIQHNTGEDRDDDGTMDTDDLQEIQNGDNVINSVAVDDSNKAIFIGAGELSTNDGSLSIIGVENDSRLDTYTEDNGKIDDNGRPIGESGTILSDIKVVSVAGEYSHPYLNGVKQTTEKPFYLAFTDGSYVWMENAKFDISTAVTTLAGSTISKQNLIAQNSLTVLGSMNFGDLGNTDVDSQPFEAFRVDNGGNIFGSGTLTVGTASALKKDYNIIGNGAAIATRSGQIENGNDLFVTDDLELGGDMLLTSGTIVERGIVKRQSIVRVYSNVHVYDTAKDDDGGAWRNTDRARATSWYNETTDGAAALCITGTHDRCGSKAFPEKAVITGSQFSSNGLISIFDAEDGTLWMSFSAGANNALSSSTVITDITAKNGVLYLTTNNTSGNNGMGILRIDFPNDQIYAYANHGEGSGNYLGTISQRNSGSDWDDNAWRSYPAYPGTWAIDTQIINGKTYVAIATSQSLGVINETDNTSVRYYDNATTDVYYSLDLTEGGELYALNATLGQLERWDNIHFDAASSTQDTPDKVWDETTTPSLTEDAATPNSALRGNSLEVTEGTSTVDTNSNTIYLTHGDGVTAINDKPGDETNSSVKYYTTSYITEEMPGDVRGMWPLNLNDTAADLEDRSVKTNNLTATNIDSNDAASGVRGKGADFNGTDEVLAVATASDADVDFNGSEAFSISAWVKPTTMPGSGEKDLIVGKWDETSNQAAYRIILENDDGDSTGNFQVDVYDESATQAITATQSNDKVVANQWYHLVLTFNGGATGAAGDLKLYVNGEVYSSSLNASFLGLEDLASDFTIGDYDADDVVATNTAFAGVIDEVMVTAETLTASQVKRIADVGRGALSYHNSGADRDGDGTTDTDDLQELQNGEDDAYAVAVDDGNRAIFIGTGDSNDGAVSVIGVNNDSRMEAYTEDGNRRDDVGKAIGADEAGTYGAGVVLSDVYSLAISGVYNNSTESKLPQPSGSAFVFAFTDLGPNPNPGFLWIETTDIDLGTAVSQLTTPTFSKETIIARNLLKVVNSQPNLGSTYPSLPDLFSVDQTGTTFVSGNLGVGTQAPAFKLDVTDSQSATVSAMITNSSTGSNADVLALKVGATSIGSDNRFITFLDGNGIIRGKIQGNGGSAVAYTTDGIDFAEYFKKADLEEVFNPGDLVCLKEGTGGVTRCQTGTTDSILGVISTNAGFVGGSSHEDDPNYVLVGLVGQLRINTLSTIGLKPNDALTISALPGLATRATNATQIVGRVQEVLDETTVFATIQPGWFDPDTYRTDLADMGLEIADVTVATDSAEIASGSATPVSTGLTYVLKDAAGNVVTKIGAFSNAAVGNLKAGAITTKDFAAEKISVAGKSIEEFVDKRIAAYFATKPVPLSEVVVATDSAQVIQLATDSATLDITDYQGNTVAQFTSEGDATLLGSLTTDSVITREASVAGAITAESARLEQLEAKLAQLESVKAQTAEFTTATVSGTLFAQELDATQITGFEDKVANTLKAPSLLAKLMQQDSTPSATSGASVASLFQIVDDAGYVASSAGQLNKLPSDLNLTAEDISLGASAVFVDKYFKAQGDAYIGQRLGVGQELIVADTLRMGDNYIEYTAPEGTDQVLSFQPSGNGTLSFLAGVMTVEDNGLVSITGNLKVSGNVEVDGSLLTNLLEPTSYADPLQVKLSSRSGEVAGATTDTRLEIVGAENQPVATISAQGQGSFANGLKIGSDDLTGTSGATLTSDKTSGKATIFTGANEVSIVNPHVTRESLIYVTPLSSTGNQVIYVKQQQAEDPQTTEKEGVFVVGFEQPLSGDVTFSWWIVN